MLSSLRKVETMPLYVAQRNCPISIKQSPAFRNGEGGLVGILEYSRSVCALGS